jgi:predicted nucleic acid-binding Zn ribbon protein
VADSAQDEKLRRARQALAAVRSDAQARGLRPARSDRRDADPAAAGIAADPAAEPPAPGPPDSASPSAADPPDSASPSATGQPAPGQTAPGATASGPLVPAPRAGRPPGRRVRRDDPQALSTAIESLLTNEGWGLAAATGSVFGRWAQIVGPELAAHTQPESLRDGELTVQADSTAWATQLRLLAAQLVRRLNAELGQGTVLRVKVRGPVTSVRKPGEWRVRGGRGPRDTYG